MAPSPAAGLSLTRPSSGHLSPAAAGSVLQPVSGSHVSQQRRRRRFAAGVVRAAPDAPPAVRAAVSAVTELLRVLSPSKKPRDAAQEDKALDPPPCDSVEDVLAVLQDDYRRAYFLTGDFTPGIYTEDCLFEDPTIKFRGLSRYSQNLDLLVPFFDSPSLELENIEKGLRVETRFVKATWKLRTYLRLPWRPLIAIRGNTTYDLNEDYKVVRHSESWDVSALEAIGQIFVSAPEQRKGS
ncbi:hypothetical protein SEVIR_2G080000v4 [Setaria viridis]|uniref:Uncharacterized protein n=1 Tax=Setaria viridis TaxID=4556 RepID=A0A4U6VMV4_SETVI|nr:uncharacterized protein LOC117843814 [Setaria viridis]TKW31058.1 hypothetical protein SEVIR_2G080000v2 [Setaria viridis]